GVSVRGIIGPSAVELAKLGPIAIERSAGLLQLATRRTYVRNFRLSVGTPGNEEPIRTRTAHEQCVAHDDARMRVSRVGELQLRAHVTGRIDVRMGGAQACVRRDARSRIK